MNTTSVPPVTIAEATRRGAEALRFAIAARRDRLVRRQRKQYDAARQVLIDDLGDNYRLVYAMQLEHE